jgi:pSer/pThr/pTyr-binding forkhead associated (FHA) protein
MSSISSAGIKFMEGRTYTIGREGHIYIDSPRVSKYHAEIKIRNGRIFLRDLNSTNGTYLVKNKKLVYFEEGYVHLHQVIMIGDKRCSIDSLLAIASNFTDAEDTIIIRSQNSAFDSINRFIDRRAS